MSAAWPIAPFSGVACNGRQIKLATSGFYCEGFILEQLKLSIKIQKIQTIKSLIQPMQ